MMSDVSDRPMDLDELEQIIRAADPSALLVPPRILRRVIKRHHALDRVGLQVPHRHVYTASSQALRAVVSGAELGIGGDEGWPDTAILLERPAPEDLAGSTRAATLGVMWRMLFHARVHLAVESALDDDRPCDEAVAERVARIGRLEFEEVRSVLRQEGLLLPPGDDATTYVEFAACYLELRRFAPALLPHTFPGIEDPAAVETVLARDVDDAAIFEATRLPGAAEPTPDAAFVWEDDGLGAELEPELDDTGQAELATGASRRLIYKAANCAANGNLVRAAVLWSQAARRAAPQLAESVRAGARGELDRLVRRLQRALAFDDGEAERWKRALPPLLDRSARGFWTAEARLLYDLQKVCVDHEREVFTMDLIDWIASLGRRPLRRVQPYLREVMIATHLRSATRRLSSVRLSSDDRARLSGLLHPAVRRAEIELRTRLRGPVDVTLTATGFRPRNLPERVAYRKLIEEILDRVATRGYLSIGDLRDACSRSNLKLPDLPDPRAFLAGDRLLQADAALADSLDGVYRHGEVYLRWLQRFSSLAFATRWGRFLTSYVALPFGGIYVTLEGLQHIVEPITHALGGGHVHIMNTASLLVLGTVALGVLNFRQFRRGFLNAVRTLGRGLRVVLIDSLAWVLRQPLLRLLFAGRFASFVWRFALKPALLTLPVLGMMRALTPNWRAVMLVSGVVFVEAMVVVNSRIGQNVEEIVTDEAVRMWRQLYRDIVPGLYRMIMGTFDAILESVDRVLYAVDEWLRFRAGQPRTMLAAKVIMGTAWFFVAYFVRICVNLLIEPQVNPIKHFPVVTVSHKILLGFSKTLLPLFAAPFMPLGVVVANFMAASTMLLLPGVFGFLVWEFKENWRLYAANRREALGRVVVGSHGETILRLLRPGFHSGTLPKLFAKLRKGERRWLEGGREKAVIKHREALLHVEESIREFIEREFLALLHESRSLGALSIELEGLAVSTNRIRIDLAAGHAHGESLSIELEVSGGRLVAEVVRGGWLRSLSEPQRRTLTTAIVGLYELSGIEWIRVPCHDEPGGDGRAAAVHELISIERVAVSWKSWVEAWEREWSGQPPVLRATDGLRILPPPAPEPARGHTP